MLDHQEISPTCILDYWSSAGGITGFLVSALQGTLLFRSICSDNQPPKGPGLFQTCCIPDWWRPLSSWGPSEPQTCFWGLLQICSSTQSSLWALASVLPSSELLLSAIMDLKQAEETSQRWSGEMEEPLSYSSKVRTNSQCATFQTFARCWRPWMKFPQEEAIWGSGGPQAADLLCNCGVAAQLKYEWNIAVNAKVSGGQWREDWSDVIWCLKPVRSLAAAASQGGQLVITDSVGVAAGQPGQNQVNDQHENMEQLHYWQLCWLCSPFNWSGAISNSNRNSSQWAHIHQPPWRRDVWHSCALGRRDSGVIE